MSFQNVFIAVTVMAFSASLASAQHNHDAQGSGTHNHDGHDHAGHDHAAHDHAGHSHADHQPASTSAGPHGGSLTQVGELRIETLVESGGLRVFAYNAQGQPVDLRNARGLATMKIEGAAKQYRYDLFPEILANGSAAALAVAVDLSTIAGRTVDIGYQIAGLQGAEQRPLQFTIFATVPLTDAQQVAAAIAEQKVCPISGQPLGGMGEPVPVTMNGKTIYVCCAGCINKVKADPAKYFAAKPTLHVAPATEADAEAIAYQKLCPVMDEPLGGMGTPLKVTGLERDVFLCCKGCLKFLKKDPQKFLAKLPPLPETTRPAAL